MEGETRAQVCSEERLLQRLKEGMLRAPNWRIDLFIHSVNKYLLGTNYFPGARDTVSNKTQP